MCPGHFPPQSQKVQPSCGHASRWGGGGGQAQVSRVSWESGRGMSVGVEEGTSGDPWRVLLKRAGTLDSSLYFTSQIQTSANPTDSILDFKMITRTYLLLSTSPAAILVQAAVIPLLDWFLSLLTGLPLPPALYCQCNSQNDLLN